MATHTFRNHGGDALVAVFKAASVVVIGYLFAMTGNASRAFRNGLFKILVTLLLPFLVFVTVAENITEQNVAGLGFVIFASTFQLLTGLLLGWIWMKVFNPRKVIHIMAVVSTAMGNWFEITVGLCLFLDGKTILEREAFNGQLAIAYTTASIALFRMFLAYVFEIACPPLSSPSGGSITYGVPTSGQRNDRDCNKLDSIRLSVMRPWSFDDAGWNGAVPIIAAPKPTADASTSRTLMAARSSTSTVNGKISHNISLETIRAKDPATDKATEVRDVPSISRQISKASSVTKFVRSSMHQLKGWDQHFFHRMEEETETWVQMCEEINPGQKENTERLALTDEIDQVEGVCEANIDPFGPDDTLRRVGNINPFKKKKRLDALARMLKDVTGMGGSEGSGSKCGDAKGWDEILGEIRKDDVEAEVMSYGQKRRSTFRAGVSSLFHPINIAKNEANNNLFFSPHRNRNQMHQFALGIMVAVTPLKHHVVTAEVKSLTSLHKLVTSIYEMLLCVSQSAVPIGLLHLGTSLHIPSKRRFSPPTLGPMCSAMGILARLMILPMIAIMFTRCFNSVITPDPELKFAMMATGCGPTAVWGIWTKRVSLEPKVDEDARIGARTKRGIGMVTFMLMQHLCSCASLILHVTLILWII